MDLLDRLHNARRPVTALEVRCSRNGHLAMSVHPELRPNSPDFVVWVRTRQLAPDVSDQEHWAQTTQGNDGDRWTRLGESAEKLSVHQISDHDEWLLACRCSRWNVTGDQVYEALGEWKDRADRRHPVVLR